MWATENGSYYYDYDLDNYKHIYEDIDNTIYIIGIKHLINYLIYILKRNISHFKKIVIVMV